MGWGLFIVVLAWRVLRELFRPVIAAGVILGAGGAALVIGGQGAAFEARHLSGYALALGSALAWSSYTVLLRKWGGGREFLLPASAGSAVLSAVWLLAAGLPEAPSAPAWGAIAYLGVVAVGMAILAWERAVVGGQIAALGAMVYLAPFLSVFFLWLILGKPIGAAAIAGMALIAAGGAAAAWRREAGRGPGSNG